MPSTALYHFERCPGCPTCDPDMVPCPDCDPEDTGCEAWGDCGECGGWGEYNGDPCAACECEGRCATCDGTGAAAASSPTSAAAKGRGIRGSSTGSKNR